MNEFQENQDAIWPWVIGAALGIGAIVLLARPKTAAAKTTGALSPDSFVLFVGSL